MWKLLLVFFAGMVYDWVWAAYITYTAEKQAGKAAVVSGAIFGLGAFMVMSYLDDMWALASAICGGMLGTYLFVRFAKSKA
jgi:hypothetical protein